MAKLAPLETAHPASDETKEDSDPEDDGLFGYDGEFEHKRSWSDFHQDGKQLASLRAKTRYMISPHSPYRVTWDLIAGLWLLYIAIVL